MSPPGSDWCCVTNPGAISWHPSPVNSTEELETLIPEWWALPDVAERLGVSVAIVRRLVDDRELLALRQGSPKVWRVPEVLLEGNSPVPDLRGTLTVLADSGYDDVEALRWLITEDDSLPGRPIDALREGRKTEVRRRAQALLF